MNDIIKVASAQLAPVFLNKEKTAKLAAGAIREASGEGAKLIVFPEAFIPGYPDWTWLIPNSRGAELNELYLELVKDSISVPGDIVDFLCKAAKESGINVIIGINERNSEASNSSLYNTLLFIDKNGKLIGKHRKLLPTGGERLIWTGGDGSSLVSYQTNAGRLAGLICWENFMPLARFSIYSSGVQILAAPTWDKSAGWLQSMQHISREGGLFVISTCMAIKKDDIPDKYSFKKLYPEGRDWINTGNSAIIGPDGKIISGPLESEKKILYAEIDLEMVIKAKRMFDAAGHYHRPDIFEFSIKTLK